MNQDQIKGKFTELHGKIKETWDRLSDDDIALANDRMEQFLGKVQQAYGITKEAAQDTYNKLAKLSGCTPDKPCGSNSNKPCKCASEKKI